MSFNCTINLELAQGASATFPKGDGELGWWRGPYLARTCQAQISLVFASGLILFKMLVLSRSALPTKGYV